MVGSHVDLDALFCPRAVVSPFRQQPMRGAFAHWARNGYRRLAQQAVYFAVPLGLGPFASPLRRPDSCLVARLTRLVLRCCCLHAPPPPIIGYAVIQWAVKDNHLRNSKHGQAQGLFP